MALPGYKQVLVGWPGKIGIKKQLDRCSFVAVLFWSQNSLRIGQLIVSDSTFGDRYKLMDINVL